MNRTTLFDGLAERYGAAAEYPWAKSPDFAVFRHTGNRKWFCLYMPVPSEKLGMGEGGLTEIVNVKCRHEHIGAWRATAGILPAYHMSKEHWLSIELEQADDALIRQLIDDSFRLTQGKAKIRKQAT